MTKDHLHRLHPTTSSIHLSVSRDVDESDYTKADSGTAYESNLMTIEQRIEKLKESLQESSSSEDSEEEEEEEEEKIQDQRTAQCYVCEMKFTSTKQLNTLRVFDTRNV